MPDPIFDSALLSMCMTWRHDFGLLDRKEQMAVRKELLGLYEHHVKPAIDRAESAESSLEVMRLRAQKAINNACADREAWQHLCRLEAEGHKKACSDRNAALARAERAEEILRYIADQHDKGMAGNWAVNQARSYFSDTEHNVEMIMTNVRGVHHEE